MLHEDVGVAVSVMLEALFVNIQSQLLRVDPFCLSVRNGKSDDSLLIRRNWSIPLKQHHWF